MRVQTPYTRPPYALTVVDTNVLLSAALVPKGVPARLVDRLLATDTLVFSDATFAEFESRLWRPKFDRYLSLERRRQLLHLIHGAAAWVSIPDALVQRTFSRDPDDDAFIHAALAAGVMRLVSGDADLLCLDPLDMLRIVTPRAALDEINALQ